LSFVGHDLAISMYRLTSEWQTPPASTLRSTCPGPGLGIGTSSRTTLVAPGCHRNAIMFPSLAGKVAVMAVVGVNPVISGIDDTLRSIVCS
jgi:hypothetical protein